MASDQLINICRTIGENTNRKLSPNKFDLSAEHKPTHTHLHTKWGKWGKAGEAGEKANFGGWEYAKVMLP